MHSLLTGYPSTRSLQRIDIHAAKKNCKLMIENNVLSTCISALVAFTKAYDAHTDVGAVPMVFANCLMYSLGGRNYTSLWISYFYFYCLELVARLNSFGRKVHRSLVKPRVSSLDAMILSSTV